MIKIILLYMLLVVSLVFPPLVFVSLPLLFVYVRGIVRRRRVLLATYDQVVAERRTDAVVRYFR